jgi:preprotein translocase subunit SecD
VATKAARPGRRLIIFGLVIAALYGAVALGGVWKPKLGLDLQGGTMITLSASTENGGSPAPDKLEEARGIIDNRVNASGVTEAEVSTQGSSNIVVEVPGENPKHLVDLVKQTAQLRFRIVAAAASGIPAKPSATPSSSPSASSSGSPTSESSPSAKTSPKATAKSSATPKGRALSSGLVNADKAKPTKQPSKKSSATPTATPQATPSAAPTSAQPAKAVPLNPPLAWSDSPGANWVKKFTAFTCPVKGQKAPAVVDLKDKPLITCDDQGTKYLLSVPAIEGTDLTAASAGIPQNQVQYAVNLTLNSHGRKIFADLSRAMVNTSKQFAIVLDGKVLSAPGFDGVIPDGQAQITGDFTQEQAQSLANSLKYGALPLKFTVPVESVEGPSLAADQLSAGLVAGAVGLLLVLVYCMLYYRGLGLVVLASLVIAAVITYAMVLVLSQSVGFTLTLPGIAGLIVAVGITADSFIVYFERIRDEMRGGKSMRVAVEAGWKRARATCVAADTVSLLAAVVLYIFAIGVVRGFAFTLGVSTVIDLVVFFCFTKPMVSLLATRRFFNSGHKLSGLSADHIGIDRIVGAQPRATAAGGNA